MVLSDFRSPFTVNNNAIFIERQNYKIVILCQNLYHNAFEGYYIYFLFFLTFAQLKLILVTARGE
jgi:hypothetical protein